MRDLDFNRHFDVDQMLYEDAIWLSAQTVLPKEQFLYIASRMALRVNDWDIFWKKVREMEHGRKIECYIGSRRYDFTEEEFEVAKQILNCPDPEEYSSCCNSQVRPHKSNIHISKCKKCGKTCRIIYEF